MDNAVHNNLRSVSVLPQIAVVQRKVKNPHLVQLYIRSGHGPKGPWIALGVNDREYIVGFK